MAKKYHTIAISEGMSVPQIRSDRSGTGMTKVIRFWKEDRRDCGALSTGPSNRLRFMRDWGK